MELLNVTLNPNDMNGAWGLTNGDLTATIAASTTSNIRATHGKVKGKWYWEVKYDSGNAVLFIGIANKLYPITSAVYNVMTGDGLNIRLYYGSNGNKFPESATYGTGWVVGDVIGVALDLDKGELEFYKNGVSMGVSHTNLKDMGEVFPIFKSGNTTTKRFTVNFGATPFAQPIPVGYKAYADIYENKILLGAGDGKVRSISQGKHTENLIPKMTANVMGEFEVSASNAQSNAYSAYGAFDRGAGYWVTTSSAIRTGWLKMKLDTARAVGKYTITPRIGGASAPKDWTFEGSDTGSFTGEQVILDVQTNITGWEDSAKKEFVIKNNKTFKFYRINITDNGGQSYLGIDEFEVMESLPSVYMVIPTQTEQDFINHGMTLKDLASIDPTGEITEKHYIVNQPTPLGAGKVFTQPLDVNKIIKKVTIV